MPLLRTLPGNPSGAACGAARASASLLAPFHLCRSPSFEATCMFGLLKDALMTCTSFSPSACVMLDCTRAVQLACGG